MTLTRSHETRPGETALSTWHGWTVGDESGSIALWALSCDPVDPDALPASARHLVAEGWVFGVIQTHDPVAEPSFGCRDHEGCEMDAVVSQVAHPAWDRITAADVTDETVYTELEAIHQRVYGEAAA